MDIKRENIPYGFFKKQLGRDARLSVCWTLMNPEGEVIREDSFFPDEKMPMASTMKVALALQVLKMVFEEKQFQLADKVTLIDSDFIPGAPWNTLDRYYFSPFDSSHNRTIDELLTFMLTESDNTATDKLLSLVGGVDQVNAMMRNFKLDGYFLTSTVRQLLADYYQINSQKTSFWNSMLVGVSLLDGFNKKDTENVIFNQNQNVCQPNVMVDLLKLLYWARHNQPENWLGNASKIILEKMEQCKTGLDLIRAGAATRAAEIKSISDKTGSMGGILNDIALIEFKNGNVLVLSAFSSHSPLSREERVKCIAALSHEIMACTGEEENVRSYFES